MIAAKLAPEERALIDAAVAAGRVTRVPTGASSWPGYRWTGNQLREIDPDGAAAQTWRGRNKGAEIRAGVSLRNRAAVAADHAAGRTVAEIAAIHGLSHECVYRHVRAILRKEGQQTPQQIRDAETARRRAIVASHLAEGKAVFAVARELGWPVSTVQRHARAIREAASGQADSETHDDGTEQICGSSVPYSGSKMGGGNDE